MISTLFVWLYTFWLALGLGSIGVLGLCTILGVEKTKELDLEIVLLTGVGLLMWLVGVSSLFISIGWEAHLLMNIICLGAFFSNRKWILEILKVHGRCIHARAFYALFSMLALVVLVQSVKHPFWTDVGEYHAQSIQWIEKYGVVKGLANLHDRFGYNNGSHLLSAFFNLTFLVGFPLYQAISSFLLLVWFSICSKGIAKGAFLPKKIFLFGSCILLLIYHRDLISSPNPDLVCVVYILSTVTLFLFSFKKMKTLGIESGLVFFLSATVMVVKISALPVVYFCILICYFAYPFSFTRWMCLIGMSFLVLLPQFIRNYVISGYLMFPFASLDLFDPDWKVAPLVVKARSYDIYSFTRVYVHVFHKVDLKFMNWFPAWFTGLEFYNKVIFSSVPLSPILAAFVMRKESTNGDYVPYAWVNLVCFCSLLYWFCLAPSFRFAHGFMIASSLSSMILLIYLVGIKSMEKGAYFAVLFTLIAFGLHSVRIECWELVMDTANRSNILLRNEPYKKVAYFEEKIGSDKTLSIKVPYDYKFCWNEPLPCSCEYAVFEYNKGLELRNKLEMGEGFRNRLPYNYPEH